MVLFSKVVWLNGTKVGPILQRRKYEAENTYRWCRGRQSLRTRAEVSLQLPRHTLVVMVSSCSLKHFTKLTKQQISWGKGILFFCRTPVPAFLNKTSNSWRISSSFHSTNKILHSTFALKLPLGFKHFWMSVGKEIQSNEGYLNNYRSISDFSAVFHVVCIKDSIRKMQGCGWEVAEIRIGERMYFNLAHGPILWQHMPMYQLAIKYTLSLTYLSLDTMVQAQPSTEVVLRCTGLSPWRITVPESPEIWHLHAACLPSWQLFSYSAPLKSINLFHLSFHCSVTSKSWKELKPGARGGSWRIDSDVLY